MGFVCLATVDELRDDEPLAVEFEDQNIAIVKYQDEIFAIQDECSHAYVKLSEGEVADCAIECPLHGAAFDLRTGEAKSLPATEAIAVYPTRIQGNEILVDLSEER